MDFPQIWTEFFKISRFARFSSNFDTVLFLLRTILCWSVAIRVFNTFSLKVIYIRFVQLGYTVLKRMSNIKITTKKAESERTRLCVLTIQD